MTKPGNKPFRIEYLESVVAEDISNLPKTIRERVKSAIETRLTVDPVGLGKPLRYSFIGHRRIRVGDYRIVYRIDLQNNLVVIVVIKHRKDVQASECFCHSELKSRCLIARTLTSNWTIRGRIKILEYREEDILCSTQYYLWQFSFVPAAG